MPTWTLGDRVRKAREVAGLTQTELAERLGVSRKTVANYEADRTSPQRPLTFVERLSGITGVSAAWILGAVDGEAPGQ